MMGHMDSTTFRAGDADREQVAQLLYNALGEGRLDLTEYDERLARTLAARTYADLDVLVADLPGASPPSPIAFAGQTRGFVVPGGGSRSTTFAWMRRKWEGWLIAAAVLSTLWGTNPGFYWPGFILVPWGGRLLVETARGIRHNEPQRWAAKKALKAAKKARKAVQRTNFSDPHHPEQL